MVASPRTERIFAQIIFVQILLFLVDGVADFVNFVLGNGAMAFIACTVLFNSNNA